MDYTKAHEGAQHNFTIITRCQVFLLITHAEGSTRPSATKRGYIISHSDLSKSAIETEPSWGADAAKARSTSTFALLDLFCRTSVGAAFCRQVFLIFWVGKSLKRDLRPSSGTLIACMRELEASALSAMYTLTTISLGSGQFSNESGSELSRECDAGESWAGLRNNESNSASVSLEEISTTSALGFVIIKCGCDVPPLSKDGQS
jgi:hypothetical protein